jgi:hypothetical protein
MGKAEGDESRAHCQAEALGRSSRLLPLVLALAMFVLGSLVLASSSQAATTLCGVGSSAGSCVNPQGVATDFETGRIYVADKGNDRVLAFDADGDFLFAFGWGVDTGAAQLQTCTTASGCQAGIPGSAAGQLSAPTYIAVDNAAGSPSRHDVFVGTDNFRVQRFSSSGAFVTAFGWGVDTGASQLEACTAASGCQAGIQGGGECQLSSTTAPLTVGPGGRVFVADSIAGAPGFTNRLERFSAAGACEGVTALAGEQKIAALAVDSAERVYLSYNGLGGVHRSGAVGCTLDPDKETTALALDGAGNLLAAQKEGSRRVLTQYDSSCETLRRFGYGEIDSKIVGLAVPHPSLGAAVGSELGSGVRVFSAPPPGPVFFPASPQLGDVGNTWAEVKSEVNPEGEPTTVYAEYVDDADYQDDVDNGGDGFEGAGVGSTEPQALPTLAGGEFGLNPAEVLIGCLEATEQALEDEECVAPGGEYHYRLVAASADGATVSGEGTFTAGGSSPQASISALAVSGEGATLSAQVNTYGVPVTGYFEYVEESQFLATEFENATKAPDVDSDPAAALEFPAAGGSQSVDLASLAPETVYHYRLVLSDPLRSDPVYSDGQTFETSTGTTPPPDDSLPDQPLPPDPPPPDPPAGFGIQGVRTSCSGAMVLSIRAFGPGALFAKATVGAGASAISSRARKRRSDSSARCGADPAPRRTSALLGWEGASQRLLYGRSATISEAGGLIRLAIKPRPGILRFGSLRRLRVQLEVKFSPFGGGETQTKQKSLLIRP